MQGSKEPVTIEENIQQVKADIRSLIRCLRITIMQVRLPYLHDPVKNAHGLLNMTGGKEMREIEVSMLTDAHRALIGQVKAEIQKYMKVPCTGCAYCMPCPQHVDIPMAFHCYNVKYSEGKKSGMWEYVQSTAMRRETSSASQCVGCGKCEQHCPQGIPIRAMLKEAVKELETPTYRVIKWAVKTFRIY